MAETAFQSFSGEMIAMLREVLDIAIDKIAEENRTPATRAAMAETIVRGASNGILDAHDLVSMAVKTGAVRAP